MSKFKKAIRIAKNEGTVSLGIKALQKIQQRQQKTTEDITKKRTYSSLVHRSDVMSIDLNKIEKYVKRDYHNKTKTINWVMSPPAGGGGHQNIFRFIDFLDKAGYKNNVYLYSTFDDTTTSQARENVAKYSNAKNTKFDYFNYDKVEKGADAIFATGWETAYPVKNLNTPSKKFYFVQDFEPMFYPMGTDYILAENTYSFGFHGITAGGWLSSKLSKEYGMKTDYYNFGSDNTKYKVTNTGKRNSIFFYARPVTERRGFDLGLMALEVFHEMMPDVDIHFAGWDVSEWSVPFPYENHKAVDISKLNDLYNQSSAALVLSLTNMSLLPLELLSSGTIPVVNEGDNNLLVSSNENIRYTKPTPQSLAAELVRAVRDNSNSEIAIGISNSVGDEGWSASGEKFLSILESELYDE